MHRQRYALILLLVLPLPSAAVAQTSLRPEAGVVLLRNGNVIDGLITRAGDFYIVTLGTTGEIRLNASEVEAVCGSLDEAYEFKQRHLLGTGIKPHLDLAEWCLRQNLPGRCAQQLVAAMKIDPDHEQLKHLERRLELAQAARPPVEKPPAAPPTISADRLDETLRTLPTGSIEKFAAIVQPILLNRCGANQCHGPAAKSEFRLMRPPEGQIATRRITQRNLASALAQLKLSDPESSPLLTLPQGRHGSALTAVFDKHSQNQLAELISWAKLTAPPPMAAVPATIGPVNATLSQPAGTAARVDVPVPPAQSAAPPRVGVMRPPLDAPASRSADSPAYTPRDRFDPEIFNRRFHSK